MAHQGRRDTDLQGTVGEGSNQVRREKIHCSHHGRRGPHSLTLTKEDKAMSEENHAPELPPEEQAFNSATAGSQLGDKPLAAFTPARERAAQAMGMKMPSWSGEDIDAIRAGKPYPGALRDAIIFTWLRSIPNQNELDAENAAERVRAKAERRSPAFSAGWTVQGAERSPGPAYEAACVFADEQGIALGSSKFADALALVIEKGLDILNSRFDITGGEGGEGESGNA
jgi:hypothetical protein